MIKTEYHDFHLALESSGAPDDDGIVCRILRSLAGRATSRFQRPGLLPGQAGLGPRQEGEIKGRALFEALFDGEVGEKYRQSLIRLEGNDNRRRALRIRLAIDPDDAKLADLFECPWETLFDDARDRFLARSRKTTLVHDLEVPTTLLDLPGTRPLRVLVVGASPEEWNALDFDGELAGLRRAFDDMPDAKGLVEIETMPRATFRDLRRRFLSGDPVNVLHFIGHGEVDVATVEGNLIFEDGKGGADPVSGKRLADVIGETPSLRLVVLNACESAKGPGDFPARSVAASLIKAHIPAVLAMRRRVADRSATAFSEGFYWALAQGMEVDAAVASARLDIDDTDELFEQWSIPAFFTSSLDGRIFKFGGAEKEKDMEPKRLGIRSRKHPFGKLEDECEHVLELLPFFEGRPIRDPADWSDQVVPYIDSFLRQHVHTARPLVLRFDAHLTISFAAGWLIDTRGVDVTILQALMSGGFHDWRFDPGEPYGGSLWKVRRKPRDGVDGRDVAIAVGITNDNLEPVERYVDRHLGDRIGHILAVTPEAGPGNDALRSANHAFALAQELKRLIDQRTEAEEAGALHLFFAAPGVFTFYLGQLARGFGEIQLYEWEFEKRGSRNYTASLYLAPEEGGRS